MIYNLSTHQVANLPLSEQTYFADEVCVTNARDEEFAEDQSQYLLKDPPNWEETFPFWNITSIGNTAYMAKYAPTERHRLLFRSCLTRYIEWNNRQYRNRLLRICGISALVSFTVTVLLGRLYFI